MPDTHSILHQFIRPIRLLLDFKVTSVIMFCFFVGGFQLDPQTLQNKDWQRTVITMNGVGTKHRHVRHDKPQAWCLCGGHSRGQNSQGRLGDVSSPMFKGS